MHTYSTITAQIPLNSAKFRCCLPPPTHTQLVNNSIQAEEAPLSPTIIKKNDVNKVDACDLGIKVPL